MTKKRSKGEGCIRKLKSGNWHGEIMDGYTDDGKKNIVSFSAPTRAEVLDLIRIFGLHFYHKHYLMYLMFF